MGNDLRELQRQARARHSAGKEKPFKTAYIVWIIMAIVGIAYLIYVFFSPDSRIHKCAWCGKTEPCDSYRVQTIEGYNADGSIKFGVDIVYIGDKCYPDALENGVEKGWINIKER